ncbi:MAG TPA: HTTM domain-containing protein [Rickettsiales bacterium]|nr:HTTM domain-containing protein [Rickettsiales bacterium]
MSLAFAVRITEILLALAFLQQSVEHLHAPQDERRLFLFRIVLSALLLLGIQPAWMCLGLGVLALFILRRFHGPYNGGSDRMSLLILFCLICVHFMPVLQWKEYAFGYLALQCVLSYFIAGWVKIVNPEWRKGRALQDVFRFSAYPVSESLRGWAHRPKLLLVMSWAVMLFELSFPLTLLTHVTLIAGLVVAAAFHFANACLFGLNRFFWIWLAAYPSILWFQERIGG